MKQQTLINILIFFMFAGGVYFIIKPLVAELHFDSARKLKAQYSWSKAAEECGKAVACDPSNAEYHSELGRLYLTIGKFGRSRSEWYLKAEEEYRRAVKLNPTSGSYYLDLGRAQFELLSDKADISNAELAHCIGNLNRAVELKPRNYYVNAAAGYYCLLLYERIKARDEDRGFALSKLRYALELNPAYSRYLYAALWNRFKDFDLLQEITPDNLTGQQKLLSFIEKAGLWQYRKEQADLVKMYKEKEQPLRQKQTGVKNFYNKAKNFY